MSYVTQVHYVIGTLILVIVDLSVAVYRLDHTFIVDQNYYLYCKLLYLYLYLYLFTVSYVRFSGVYM